MGSSPTPWPSGSIQCIPDVRVGSDARSSRHVLGNETLLPTDRSPMAVKTSLSFSNSLISNSCCKSFSSSRITFDFKSSKCVTFSSSSSNRASLAANPSLILLSIWNRTGSLLYDVRTILFKVEEGFTIKNEIVISYIIFQLFHLRSVVQGKTIGRRRQNQNQDGNL